MVIVDVFVPSVDKTYNFSLNERVALSSVISEITEMIEQKERVSLLGDRRMLRLYERKKAMLLPLANSLGDCGVKSGSELILV